jgi:hypothetical protein
LPGKLTHYKGELATILQEELDTTKRAHHYKGELAT